MNATRRTGTLLSRHCHNQFRMKPSGHLFRTRHTRSLRSVHLDISHDLPLLNTTKETSGETSIAQNRIHNRVQRCHATSLSACTASSYCAEWERTRCVSPTARVVFWEATECDRLWGASIRLSGGGCAMVDRTAGRRIGGAFWRISSIQDKNISVYRIRGVMVSGPFSETDSANRSLLLRSARPAPKIRRQEADNLPRPAQAEIPRAGAARRWPVHRDARLPS
mgnify:CR=1 FL=1